MPRYLVQWGKNPALSAAELVSYLQARKISFTVVQQTETHAILQAEPVPASIASDLGGSLLVAELYGTVREPASAEFERLQLYQRATARTKTGKVAFSFLSLGPTLDLDPLQSYVKEKAKGENLKFQWVGTSRFETAHSSLSRSQSRRETVQFVAYQNPEPKTGNREIWVGATLGAHNPRDFRFRDMNRPAQRSIYSIPPRLARIFLNLAQVTPGTTVVDPFCGIGGIAQEAALMGAAVRGFDKSPGIVASAKKNLAWIAKEYGIRPCAELETGDARRLAILIPWDSADAVVSEPDMGPPLRRRPNREQANAILASLRPLFGAALKNIGRVLKPGGRCVIVGPAFILKRKLVGLPLERWARESGLRPLDPLAGFPVPHTYPLSDYTERHRTIRQIWVFEKPGKAGSAGATELKKI